MNEQKFFRCNHCGNMVAVIHDSKAPMTCCNEPMQELIPNTTEASNEKHIPDVSVKERLVHAQVGSVLHPATEEHHIEFIYLQTEVGGQLKRISVGTTPSVMFAVLDDKPVNVYAYCNLHGLWKAEVPATCNHNHEEHDDNCETEENVCSAEFSEGCK